MPCLVDKEASYGIWGGAIAEAGKGLRTGHRAPGGTTIAHCFTARDSSKRAFQLIEKAAADKEQTAE